jgi:hypothetical protein
LSIGVGINLAFCPDGFTKIEGVDREVLFWELARRIKVNVEEADKNGPEEFYKKIDFEYKEEYVQILDHTLTTILH